MSSINFPSKVLEKAVEEISGLPGIGKKSAMRLALHLLKQPKNVGMSLAKSIAKLVDEINYCEACHNVSDAELCDICLNPARNAQCLCVVEDVRDVMAIENTQQFQGKYLVLGGKISPMEGIGPGQLNIDSLAKKLASGEINELIFALSASMEGDTTSYYLYKKFKDFPVKFSCIARGISVGDELEYADEVSLGRSIVNRLPYHG
jgi:recombination protein RecR